MTAKRDCRTTICATVPLPCDLSISYALKCRELIQQKKIT